MLVMLQMDQIPVNGLPQNIPDYLEIDVTIWMPMIESPLQM